MMLQFLLLALLLLQFPIASPVNMIGTVVTDIIPITIADETFNSFEMTVLSANDTAPLNENVTVVMSTLLTPPTLGSRVNVTGMWDETAQVFRATSVNVVQTTDWVAAIKQALAIISMVMSGIAFAITALIAQFTGISIPTYIVTIILEALFVVGLIKWYKTIGLVLILVVVFLLISGGITLTQFMWH